MIKINIKQIIEDLVDTFLDAGKISLELREKGLKKKIKKDNTPVTNGDIEVNKIVTKKINTATGKSETLDRKEAPRAKR